MTTQERLRQWIDFWSTPGNPDDKGPRRPDDVSEYHDKQLKQLGQTIAGIELGRGQ